jgi:hypothetical protein
VGELEAHRFAVEAVRGFEIAGSNSDVVECHARNPNGAPWT